MVYMVNTAKRKRKMHLKIDIWFEDSTTKMDVKRTEDLAKILPAFLKDENDIEKAKALAKQLTTTIKKINSLL